MPKNNFLLVDLNDDKTKKLAETITSDTSRKILDYLTEKDDTESNISEKLALPISTVHYHLHKLMEAGLILVEQFHYSQKGKEINHYKLANKYIIIAPSKISQLGIREKLRNIFPATLICIGIAGIIKTIDYFKTQTISASGLLMQKSAAPLAKLPVKEAAQNFASDLVFESTSSVIKSPDLALWFLIGSISAILIYLISAIIKEYWNNKKNKE